MKLLKFSAGWCAPCKVQKNIIEQIPDLGVEVVDIDIDSEDGAHQAMLYKVRGVPTLVLEDSGKELKRVTGLQKEEALRRFVQV